MKRSPEKEPRYETLREASMNSWVNPYVKTERNAKWNRKWSPEWRSKWNPKRNCKWHLHQSITMWFFFHGVCLPEKRQFDFSPRRFSFIVVYSKSPKRMETRTYLPIKMMFLSHGGFPTDHIHGFNFGWNMQVSLLQEFPIVFPTYRLVRFFRVARFFWAITSLRYSKMRLSNLMWPLNA